MWGHGIKTIFWGLCCTCVISLPARADASVWQRIAIDALQAESDLLVQETYDGVMLRVVQLEQEVAVLLAADQLLCSAWGQVLATASGLTLDQPLCLHATAIATHMGCRQPQEIARLRARLLGVASLCAGLLVPQGVDQDWLQWQQRALGVLYAVLMPLAPAPEELSVRECLILTGLVAAAGLAAYGFWCLVQYWLAQHEAQRKQDHAQRSAAQTALVRNDVQQTTVFLQQTCTREKEQLHEQVRVLTQTQKEQAAHLKLQVQDQIAGAMKQYRETMEQITTRYKEQLEQVRRTHEQDVVACGKKIGAVRQELEAALQRWQTDKDTFGQSQHQMYLKTQVELTRCEELLKQESTQIAHDKAVFDARIEKTNRECDEKIIAMVKETGRLLYRKVE